MEREEETVKKMKVAMLLLATVATVMVGCGSSKEETTETTPRKKALGMVSIEVTLQIR